MNSQLLSKMSLGWRTWGFTQTVTKIYSINDEYEISCTKKQMKKRMWDCKEESQRGTQTACHSHSRYKAAIKVCLMGCSFP